MANGKPRTTGAPLLADALAALDCRVTEIIPLDTHAILIGVVEDIIFGPQRLPLIHFEPGSPHPRARPGRVMSAGQTPRTGAQYLDPSPKTAAASISKARWSKTSPPIRRFAARPASLARLFDVAADPANREAMTFSSPVTGKPVWRCYHIPRR